MFKMFMAHNLPNFPIEFLFEKYILVSRESFKYILHAHTYTHSHIYTHTHPPPQVVVRR